MLKKSLFLIALLHGLHTFGQDNKTLKTYRQSPVWIDMINDPSVNYFEAVKAFEIYWENREMPVEEDEILGEKYSIEEKKKGIFGFLFSGPKNDDNKYAFEVKRFRNWQRQVLPVVQEDGRILSKEEELNIWKNQQPQ